MALTVPSYRVTYSVEGGWHRAPGSSSCQNETFGEVSKSWGPFIVSSFLITRRFLTGIVTACHTYLYNEFKASLSHETVYQKNIKYKYKRIITIETIIVSFRTGTLD